LRRNSNNIDALYDNLYQDNIKTVFDESILGYNPYALQFGVNLVSIEFIKILSGYSSASLVERAVEYDLMSGEFSSLLINRVGMPYL
jgi:hypothetical protein